MTDWRALSLAHIIEPGLNLRSFSVALVTGDVNSLNDLSVCVDSRRSTARFHSCAPSNRPRGSQPVRQPSNHRVPLCGTGSAAHSSAARPPQWWVMAKTNRTHSAHCDLDTKLICSLGQPEWTLPLNALPVRVATSTFGRRGLDAARRRCRAFCLCLCHWDSTPSRDLEH